MALVAIDEGSLTADGTEQTIKTSTVAACHVLHVDLSNMANGDIVTLRGYIKLRTGDSVKKLMYSATYANKQGDGADVGSSALGEVLAVSVPVPSFYSVSFTLKQEAGTNRAYPWRVDTL